MSDATSHERRGPPGPELPRIVGDMMAFVGLGAAELDAVRQSAPVVLRHEAALTAAVYEHLLSFPESARFFVHEDGAPDTPRIERRKESLGRWLRDTATAVMDAERAYSLLAMGISHSHRTWGRGGQVPAELMVGSMSLVQAALTRILHAELPTPAEALEASIAWNKLLLVHLNVILMGYFLPPPAPPRGP